MIDRILRVLVDAGADPVGAARAACVLDQGGSVREALDALGPQPTFDPIAAMREFVRKPEAVTSEAVSATRETGR